MSVPSDERPEIRIRVDTSQIADVFNLEKPLDEYPPENRELAKKIRAIVKRIAEEPPDAF